MLRLLQVREWIGTIGIEDLNRHLVNVKGGTATFEKPNMTLAMLMEFGQQLVQEQDNVKRVQLADEYLDGASLAGSAGSSMPEDISRDSASGYSNAPLSRGGGGAPAPAQADAKFSW